MKRKTIKAIKQTFMVSVVVSVVLLLISFLAIKQDSIPFNGSDSSVVNQNVLDYKPLVEKYAREYDVSKYVDVLLAMMMQESGGRGEDPMQASESYCGSRGCIKDPEVSIRQGVAYFSQALKKANGDLELAVQSYNFGKGFIDYVHDNNGKYSQKAAISFSQKMYQNDSDKSKYRCPRKEAKQYEACYGDIYYVRDVMKYRNVVAKQ